MNSFVDSFSKKLFQSLEEGNLHPSHSMYENVYLDIYRMGEKKLKVVKAALSPALWNSLLEGIAKTNAEGHCMRMLGFGHHLSAFMTGPFAIDPLKKEQVSHLGMLANFIVAIYDCLLDLNKKKNPLPGWLLYLCATKPGRILVRIIEPFLGLHSRIMARLVSIYFIELRLLTDESKNDSAKKLIYKSIRKMYEAEQFFGRDEKKFATHWLRKSALPFVTMGLPALLVTTDGEQLSSFKFIRNMYRLGEVFGLLDDVADMIDDQIQGQSNIVNKQLKEGGSEEKIIDVISAQVSRLLVTVYSGVNKNNLERNGNFYNFYWTPIICVIGWLGGQYQINAATSPGDGENQAFFPC